MTLKPFLDKLVDMLKDAPDTDGDPGFAYDVNNIVATADGNSAEFVIHDVENDQQIAVRLVKVTQ